MELNEEIYVNIEELRDTISTKHKGPENTGFFLNLSSLCKLAETKHVRADFVAGDETETCSSYKVATVCVGLLCFILLTTVIAVSVQYDKDYNQLSRDLANHTAEKEQLLLRYHNLTAENEQILLRYHNLTAENEQILLRYHNLTEERDHLKDTFKNTELKLDNAMKKIGSCPDGWSLFGCSCYYLSREVATWDNSKQQCLNRGADLVIITSQKEMVFLNKLGAHLFWIGLRRLSDQSNWMWTDGSSPRTTYWLYHSSMYSRTPTCASFNSFNSSWRVQSWSSGSCTQYQKYVCKKEAVMSNL